MVKKINVFCLLSFFVFWLGIISLTHAGAKEEEIPRGVNLSASYPYKEASKNKMHEKKQGLVYPKVLEAVSAVNILI